MIRKLNLQLFNDAPVGGDAPEGATFEINGQKMTAEQVVESYKKLQADHTKVTQKNSELAKTAEAVKGWTDFDNYLTELETKTGQQLKGQLGRMMDSFVQSVANGEAPTQAQMNQLSKEIDKAEKKGDDELTQRLQELEARAYQAELAETFSDFERQAEAEGIDYTQDEFQEFAAEYLSDKFGLGDDDEFTTKQLQAAYDAYEAKKLKEARKKDIPPLSTSGGTSGPSKGDKGKQSVGGIKGAAAAAAKFLGK